MINVKGLKCPSCSSPIKLPYTSRVINCDYCNKRLFFEKEDFVLKFYLEEKKTVDFKDLIEKAISQKFVAESVKKEAILVKRKKRAIPFYLISGKRGGILTDCEEFLNHKRKTIYTLGQLDLAIEPQKIEKNFEKNSRVILSDFNYVYEAVSDIMDYQSLDRMRENIKNRLDGLKSLSEISREDVEIILPVIPIENIIKKGVDTQLLKGGNIEILEINIYLVYYPVEEFIFFYNKGYFKIVVDLVEGDICYGLIPAERKWFTFLSLFVSAFSGFFIGRFLRTVFGGVSITDIFSGFTIIATFFSYALFFSSLLFSALLYFSFVLMRANYAVEITKNGSSIRRLGDVGVPFLKKFLDFLLNLMGVDKNIL